MRSPSSSMKFSFIVARLLLGDVEQHAVGVGEVMGTAGAALEKREPRLALRSRAQGEGAQMRIVVAHGLQALLHRLQAHQDRKSTRLNSSHGYISYAVFCLKKKKRDD